MMNPLENEARDLHAQDTSPSAPADELHVRKGGFVRWISQHFGAEPPHRHSENFFISDVTEGGIGSHHRHQLFRPDKRQ